MSLPRVTVWNEFRHEKTDAEVAGGLPHRACTMPSPTGCAPHGLTTVRTATLDEPEHGLTEAVLAETDVLIWWGHMAHGEVKDEIVDRVQRARARRHGPDRPALRPLLEDLQAPDGHHLQPEVARDRRDRSASGSSSRAIRSPRACGEYFEIPHDEMYGERFDIPAPDTLVFVSWFQGGEVFRSGCCFHRGAGKIFYFRPGHETFPIYYQPEVKQVLRNAVRWAAPVGGPTVTFGQRPTPLETVEIA